jgi:hypothetical protein
VSREFLEGRGTMVLVLVRKGGACVGELGWSRVLFYE